MEQFGGPIVWKDHTPKCVFAYPSLFLMFKGGLPHPPHGGFVKMTHYIQPPYWPGQLSPSTTLL